MWRMRLLITTYALATLLSTSDVFLSTFSAYLLALHLILIVTVWDDATLALELRSQTICPKWNLVST